MKMKLFMQTVVMMMMMMMICSGQHSACHDCSDRDDGDDDDDDYHLVDHRVDYCCSHRPREVISQSAVAIVA